MIEAVAIGIGLLLFVAGIAWLFVHEWRKARRLSKQYRDAKWPERHELEAKLAKDPSQWHYVQPLKGGTILGVLVPLIVAIVAFFVKQTSW